MLLSLNEHGSTRFSKDVEEGMVLLRYDLGHEDIDGLAARVDLLRGVPEHLAEFPVGIEDLAKVHESAPD